MRILKSLVIFAAAFVITILMLAVFIIIAFGGFTISQNQIERDFNRNYEEITRVVQFFSQPEFGDVYIPSYSEKKFEDIDRFANDSYAKEIKQTIEQLFSKGYEVIKKDDNYSYIMFQRWSSLDKGRGVVYSDSGIVPDEDATMLIPLPKDNWYYYEYDYNEHRLGNKTE